MSDESSDSTVVLAYENFQITQNDLNCLKPRRYINDIIINFYLKYVHKTLLNDEQQQRVHIFDSFFAEALDQMDRERTIRWLRRVNIFEKDYLLIPVNIDEHWFLMVICYPANINNVYAPGRKRARILTMDSMPHHAEEKKPQMLQYLYNFIKCALVEQRNMGMDEIGNLSRRMKNVIVDVKEQSNNFDCGICLLGNAETFLIDSFRIDPDSVEFRLSGARIKRKALEKHIIRLAEAQMIEQAVINSTTK